MGDSSRNREALERELEANVAENVVKVPRPTVNVTKTNKWASVDPILIDPGTAVTHSNLVEIASLNQAMITMLLDHGAKLKYVSI